MAGRRQRGRGPATTIPPGGGPERTGLRQPAYAGEAVPGDPALAAWLDGLTEQVEEAAARALAGSPGLEGLRGLMDEVWRAFGACLEPVRFEPPMACARGCHHCCHNPISLTQAEALVLWHHAETALPAPFMAAVRGRVDAVVEALQGCARSEMGAIRHQLLCPFIEGGACMVHPVRPLVCRGWNSVDATACADSMRLAAPDHPIENHPLPRQVADALQLGLLRGTSRLGLEAGYLALPRAAWLLGAGGAAPLAALWLAREPFFARRRSW